MEWGQWFPFLRWNKAPPPFLSHSGCGLWRTLSFELCLTERYKNLNSHVKPFAVGDTADVDLYKVITNVTWWDSWHTGSRTTIFLATTDLPVEISSWRRFFYFIHKIMSTSLIAFCNGSLFVIGRIWWSLDELFATCND